MVDARQALLLLLPLPLLLTWPSPLRTMASPVITSYSASIAPLPRGLLLLPEACRITCQGGGGRRRAHSPDIHKRHCCHHCCPPPCC